MDHLLGMDIGAVTVSMVVFCPEHGVIAALHKPHKGAIQDTIRNLSARLPLEKVRQIAVCGQGAHLAGASALYNIQVCYIRAARWIAPEARAILGIGGETFFLIRLSRDGEYLGTRCNTACAAGTGAFLDQQAGRLGLADSAELSHLACDSEGRPPKIATRCAVFAKTDLIHAQQEGYSLGQICDGLCHGLAKNVVDTVFTGTAVHDPIVFCGGVARNQAVHSHIEALIGKRLLVPRYAGLFGALGAAIALSESDAKHFEPVSRRLDPAQLKAADAQVKKAHTYPPLTLALSQYPEFDALARFEFQVRWDVRPGSGVEVDIYEPLQDRMQVLLGLDIGSTSTKAAVLTPEGCILAGFYTRTSGRPLQAVQRILAAMDEVSQKWDMRWDVVGAGTTGSGRNFIGRIIGADLVVDEITAHARAATALDPRVDTIIEIGGQDAKFTTLRNGRVTFATMNTVCAAGTGSFIEEQARKLGCELADYGRRTENRAAPLSSDRCTVFMERDLNHFLGQGYDVDEVLASVLHSVRENYLLKVASLSRIGEVVFFQGATAKNKALVAAFEQRLQKPILVSKYCHLTGAVGTALILAETHKSGRKALKTGFAGIGLHRNPIAVSTETCELCTNHCKLSVAVVNGRKLACGFLCGRDYDDQKYIKNQSDAFDLIKQKIKSSTIPRFAKTAPAPTVGLPAAGHMVEDLAMWRFFFEYLGFEVQTSEDLADPVPRGRQLSGAEFCAPITALHGHVDYLKDRCDYIFLPVYMEEKEHARGVRRHYCYYTQYSPALVKQGDERIAAMLLDPVVRYLYSGFHTRLALYATVKRIAGHPKGILDINTAYEQALEFKRACAKKLKTAWKTHLKGRIGRFQVILLGRPYTIFSKTLNCRIPDLFQRQGIDCAYQDMIDPDPEAAENIGILQKEMHWRFGIDILEAAETVARTHGAYPVLISNFKCTPDAFVKDYFKKMMAAHDKPYLILELDEHDSSVGYETRIEAAVRAFANHFRQERHPLAVRPLDPKPGLRERIGDKTLFLPHWDRLSGKLLAAVLAHEGQKVALLQETPETIRKSLAMNTGQCIPINAVAQSFIEAVQNGGYPPEDCLLWLGESEIACNIGLYPYHIKSLIDEHGKGMEKAGVYTGSFFFMEFGVRAAFNATFAYMFSGLIRKMACKTRPYELNPGETDQVVNWAVGLLAESFLGHLDKRLALTAIVERFKRIRIQPATRPKVAVFGDLYSRDNRVINQDLTRFIEANGGEVVATPYYEYAKMIASPYFRKWFAEGRFLTVLTSKTMKATFSRLERLYYRYFQEILREPMASFDDPPEEILSKYGVRIEHTGESLDNLIKVHYIRKHYPDVALFVQASPALCCPSLITEAMAGRIQAVTGVPVVSITYDGIGGFKNDAIVPYLTYPRKVSAPAANLSSLNIL